MSETIENVSERPAPKVIQKERPVVITPTEKFDPMKTAMEISAMEYWRNRELRGNGDNSRTMDCKAIVNDNTGSRHTVVLIHVREYDEELDGSNDMPKSSHIEEVAGERDAQDNETAA